MSSSRKLPLEGKGQPTGPVTLPSITTCSTVSVVKLYNGVSISSITVNPEDGDVTVDDMDSVPLSPPATMVAPVAWQVLKDLLAVDQRVSGRVLDSWCPFDFNLADNPEIIGTTMDGEDYTKGSDPPVLLARRRAGFDSWCSTMNAIAKAKISQRAEELQHKQQMQQFQAFQQQQMQFQHPEMGMRQQYVQDDFA